MARARTRRHLVHAMDIIKVFLLLWATTAAFAVTIFNDRIRTTTTGELVNAHDGTVVSFDFGQTYFLYGTVYAECHQAGPVCDSVCGFFNNTFAVYRSTTLAMDSLTLLSTNAVPALTLDNGKMSYWEPNVGYNHLTQNYTMLFWSGHFGFHDNRIAVATSRTPEGPFELREPLVMRGAQIISDTISLFVDTGDAYARYNTLDAPRCHVMEKLTPD
jgi:hypothetical protein